MATGLLVRGLGVGMFGLGQGMDDGGELAVLGGVPAFREALHVGRPNVGRRDRLLARINDILDRRWLTNHGPYVQEVEARVAAMVGVEHCVAVCNATVGLELAIRALGMTGEVIVPSLTFVATAHALSWQQITPVFCDVDPRSYTLDPARVEEAITPRTTGIIGVHLWGRPCAIEALDAIARRHDVRVLYDASHAFGCSRGGRMVGGFGDAEVFSFHATKFVNSFEGGAIVTNDGALAARLRLMKNFGFAGYDEVVYPGTNGKMTEVCAAMALTSFESIDDFVAVNYRNYLAYQRELIGIAGVRLLAYDPAERSNYQYIVLEIEPERSGLTRDDLVTVLHAEGVLARRYFHPGCHRMEPYRSYLPRAGRLLPETERLTDRVLVLPTGTAVDADAIRTIGGIFRRALRGAPEVRARIATLRSAAAPEERPTSTRAPMMAAFGGVPGWPT